MIRITQSHSGDYVELSDLEWGRLHDFLKKDLSPMTQELRRKLQLAP